MTTLQSRSMLIAFLFFQISHAAEQTCNPLFHPTRWVGDVASDSKCTDNDIQSAINAVAASSNACPATIFITREHTYTAQHLTISNTGKSITLIGQGDGVMCGAGESICVQGAVCPTDPLVTISGRVGDSVIHIDGTNNIKLEFLTISSGVVANNQGGGGIYFNGNGSLTLDRSVISFNEAGYGGGIDFIGSGGDATLTFLANTKVLSNTADVDGGGVRTEGSARFFALQDQTLIAFNHADSGHGGGLDVIAPSRADVGSSGYSGLGAVYDNSAAYGGGVSVNDGGSNSGNATARFFTTNSVKPVRVSGNFATVAGGAFYLKPHVEGILPITGAAVCLFDFVVEDNRATDGAAIFADHDNGIFQNSGGLVSINGGDVCGDESPPALGAVACKSGIDCNAFLGNTAEDSNNSVSGAVIEVSQGYLAADRLILQGNRGTTAIRADDSGGGVELSTCLLANNHTQNELISNHGSLNLDIDGCTITDNVIDNGYVIYTDTATSLKHMIIDQPGTAPIDRASGTLVSQYILANDISGLGASTLMQGQPVFVDPMAGDYHLSNESLGIDFAPAVGGLDLDRNPRDVDLIQIPNIYGSRDIGAYERQSSFVCGAGDTIFCNGYEL